MSDAPPTAPRSPSAVSEAHPDEKKLSSPPALSQHTGRRFPSLKVCAGSQRGVYQRFGACTPHRRPVSAQQLISRPASGSEEQPHGRMHARPQRARGALPRSRCGMGNKEDQNNISKQAVQTGNEREVGTPEKLSLHFLLARSSPFITTWKSKEKMTCAEGRGCDSQTEGEKCIRGTHHFTAHGACLIQTLRKPSPPPQRGAVCSDRTAPPRQTSDALL